jgi:predicted DNA-binding WGR domain protein
MTSLTLHLQARNPERNIARHYSLLLGQDFFGFWSLKINFGRIGRKGAEYSYAFPTKEDAYTKIKLLLKKRASGQNRLGCPYELIEYHRDPFLRKIEVLSFLTQLPPAKSTVKIVQPVLKKTRPIFLPLFDTVTANPKA